MLIWTSVTSPESPIDSEKCKFRNCGRHQKCEDFNKEKIYNQGDDMQSWQIFNLGLMALIVLVAKMALYDPLCLT